MTDAPVDLLVSGVAAAVTALAACCGLVRSRGTTAAPAAAWAAVAATGYGLEALARAAGWLRDPAAVASARLTVAALMLCPTMSLLGAKRPQHGVWQFIVGSLAGVLTMPAASATLVRPGAFPDVHPLQRWFMPLLVAVGWMNFVGTGQGIAASFVAGGQLLLLRPFLPFVDTEVIDTVARGDAAGACLVAIGAVLATIGPCGTRCSRAGTAKAAAIPRPLDREIDAPYRALRDTIGAAWALRIAERFNGIAASRGWPCRLRFTGLEVGGDAADGSWHRDASRGARSLFHRFATDDWLARQMSTPGSPRENGP